jgi:hypothetical protein
MKLRCDGGTRCRNVPKHSTIDSIQFPLLVSWITSNVNHCGIFFVWSLMIPKTDEEAKHFPTMTLPTNFSYKVFRIVSRNFLWYFEIKIWLMTQASSNLAFDQISSIAWFAISVECSARHFSMARFEEIRAGKCGNAEIFRSSFELGHLL